jgi:CelD/BcsL family acetyltransferase involved in cellulose biosynthesis
MISVRICSPERDIAADWADLVRRASPNVFMNPAALKAAHDTEFARIHMLLAWDDSAGSDRLVGLWALRERKISPLWPMVLEALPYDYAFLSSPVLDPAFADQVMPGFLAAIEQAPALPNVINLKSFNAELPACGALSAALAANGREQLTLTESARPVVTRESGVKRSGSTRKKLRQDWNRLAAIGAVDVVNDRTASDAERAFEIFLALEAGSWKGDSGTALLCDPHDAVFVRQLLKELAGQGNASVALLRVDGRPIAAQVLMYCGTTAYTWKTAFDAEFSKFSPGTLLVDKITEELFAGPDIETIDSCSVESSFMAQLWSGRRSMVDLLIDVGPKKSIRFALEAQRLLGYHRLRQLRDRLHAWNWRPRARRVTVASQH